GASACHRAILRRALHDRGFLPGTEVRMPCRGTAFRTARPLAAMRGGLSDRDMADVDGVPLRKELSGSELRSGLRTFGVESCVGSGPPRRAPRHATSLGRDGEINRPIGWVRQPADPQRSARSPNAVARATTHARSRLGLGYLRSRPETRSC